MKFGRIIGTAVSDTKTGNTGGHGLLVVRELDHSLCETPKTFVAVDTISAGYGDCVLTCKSSSARCTRATMNVCTDAAVIAIVDFVNNKRIEKKEERDNGK